MKEQTKRWRQDLGLPDPEPTELDLLLQKWKLELPSQEPEGEELPLPEPRGEELLLPEPKEEELPLPEPEGEEMLPHEPEGEDLLSSELEGKEVKSPPPPQPRPPPLRSSPAPLCAVPRPLLVDTLPVSLDLSSLDLEPRRLQNRSQFGTWFPASLLPSTKTSLRCSQTSLELPLITTSLPLGDWSSLHWVPAADLCPLLQPPVPRLSLRSALANRWVPSSPVRGPYLAGPGRGPIHPRVRPWKRAKMDICGLEAGLPLAVFNLAKIKPYQNGFFCNDDSIRYPFHNSTITSTVLYTVGFTLPICSMIIGECLSVHYKRLQSNSSVRNNYVACLYKAIGTFLFGAAMSQSLTDIGKYSIGRLRPHFLDVCKPNWAEINCKAGYIENFTCTGETWIVNEARFTTILGF
ncbi:UNVERIFIED_CONTAM: hypothetical protein FKN15_005182 [Acipenser sinensis]